MIKLWIWGVRYFQINLFSNRNGYAACIVGVFNPQKWTFEGYLVRLKLGQNPFLLDNIGISSRVRKFE
jgi:hypothetical protein